MEKRKENKEQSVFLDKCKEDILQKFVGNNPLKFTHADFEKLSEDIFDTTKISVSISTLKRIWNDNYSGSPNISTLDAFGKYLGYSGWRAYCNDKYNKGYIKPKSGPKLSNPKSRIFILIAACAGIVLILFFLFRNTIFSKPDYDDIEFYFEEFDSTSIPVYAVFKYNLKGIKCDSATIRPIGNQEDEFTISVDDSIATYTYMRPWQYFPTLTIDGKPVKTLKTSFVSGTWKAGLSNSKKEFYIQYYDNPSIYSDGRLAFTSEILNEINFPVNDIDYVTYDLFKRFKNIYGDSLCFETRVKNKVITREESAGRINIALCFENNSIVVPFSMDKSSNTPLSVYFFNQYFSGKNINLSFLFQQLETWNVIKFVTADKQFSLYVNDSLAFKENYELNPGKLTGIMYDFKGLGEVDYVRFFDQKGEMIYRDEFD